MNQLQQKFNKNKPLKLKQLNQKRRFKLRLLDP